MSVETELTNVTKVEVRFNLASLSNVEMLPGLVPLELPRLGDLTLYYDPREQGDLSIIEDVVSGESMTRIPSLDFSYNASPPSVDLAVGTDARNLLVDPSLIRAGADGIQTIMMLLKPDGVIADQYALDYGTNGNTILLGFVDSRWEFFVGVGDFTGDDPRTGTQMVATAGAWQTVCYTVDVDGAGKQSGYLDGALAVGPLNKTFDLTQAAAVLDLGHTNGAADLVGEFGAYLHWTVALTAAEVAQAHNFLRAINAGYGLTEA